MMDMEVQAIAAVAWRCIKECKNYSGPPVMCPAHQQEAQAIALRWLLDREQAQHEGGAVRVLEALKRERPATDWIGSGQWGKGYAEGVQVVMAAIDAKLAALRAEGEGGK